MKAKRAFFWFFFFYGVGRKKRVNPKMSNKPSYKCERRPHKNLFDVCCFHRMAPLVLQVPRFVSGIELSSSSPLAGGLQRRCWLNARPPAPFFQTGMPVDLSWCNKQDVGGVLLMFTLNLWVPSSNLWGFVRVSICWRSPLTALLIEFTLLSVHNASTKEVKCSSIFVTSWQFCNSAHWTRQPLLTLHSCNLCGP